jgi:hypothetical protein
LPHRDPNRVRDGPSWPNRMPLCPCPISRVRQPLSGETAPIGSEVDDGCWPPACRVTAHLGLLHNTFGERHFRAAKTVGSPALHLHSLPSELPVEDVHVTTALDSLVRP